MWPFTTRKTNPPDNKIPGETQGGNGDPIPKEGNETGNNGNSQTPQNKGNISRQPPNNPSKKKGPDWYERELAKTLLLISAVLAGFFFFFSIVILIVNIAELKHLGEVKREQLSTQAKIEGIEETLKNMKGSPKNIKEKQSDQGSQKGWEASKEFKNLESEIKKTFEPLNALENKLAGQLDRQKKEIFIELAKLSSVEDTAANKGVLEKIGELQSKVDNLGQKISKELQGSGSDKSAEISNKIKEMDLNLKKLLPELANLKKSLEGQPKGGKEFAGLKGDIAIMITNSEDFKLDSPILRSLLDIVEKQHSDSGNQQRLGLYMATGNIVEIKFNLKTKTRGPNPEGVPGAAGRPTENLAEAGKTLMDTAFDVNTKGPRRAVIIATWEALAPRFNQDGWDHVETVDAILLQTRAGSPFRDASNWLDFCQKKKGKLLFVQGNNNFTAGSDALNQLKKHLSVILNAQEDKP